MGLGLGPRQARAGGELCLPSQGAAGGLPGSVLCSGDSHPGQRLPPWPAASPGPCGDAGEQPRAHLSLSRVCCQGGVPGQTEAPRWPVHWPPVMQSTRPAHLPAPQHAPACSLPPQRAWRHSGDLGCAPAGTAVLGPVCKRRGPRQRGRPGSGSPLASGTSGKEESRAQPACTQLRR